MLYHNIETNQLIKDLTQYLYEQITELGYQASMLPPTYHYDEKTLTSEWSHRSAAYIAGIGTFGINNMLITEQGCCGRFGSVITNIELEASEKPNQEYCLYKQDESCGACVKKCVNSAFQFAGKEIQYDRYKCNEQIYDKIVPVYPIGTGDSCGKCMCGLPCSLNIPKRHSVF